MAGVLDSFFIALGFQVDTDEIEKFHKKANELRDTALRLGAIFTGAAVGIGLMVEKVAAGMGEVANFAELNQLSARSIEALSKAGLDFDMTAEEMRDSVGSLNKKIGEAATGIGRGKMLFEKLGLSARNANGHVRTTDEMLEVLAGRMQHMSRAQNIAIAERLGLNPKMVLMLEKGAANLRKVREEAQAMNPFSDEDYEQADKIDKLFIKAKMTLGVFTKMLAVQFFPVVKKALTAYLDWFKEVRKSEQLAQIFRVIASVVGILTDWFTRLLTTARDVFTWIMKFRAAMILVTIAVSALLAYKAGVFFTTLADAVFNAAKALMAFNAASAFSVMLFGGILIAIGLIIDELYNYYQGNETLIGQLQQKFHGAIYAAWAVLMLLVAGFVALKWTAISSMMETIAIVALYAGSWIAAHASMAVATLAAYWPVLLIIAAIGLVIAAVWYLWKNWDKVTALMKKAWTWLVDKITDGINWLVEKLLWLSQKSTDFIKKLPGGAKLMSMVADVTTSGADNNSTANNNLNSQGGVIGKAGSSSTTNTTQQNTTMVTGNPITVVSPDPAKAGESVKKELDRVNRNAVRNGQTGVAL